MEISQTSRSLKELYLTDGSLNAIQRRRYNDYAMRIITNADISKEEAIMNGLDIVEASYKDGGISHGRSVQSALLDATNKFMRGGEIEKAKNSLALLLALHHDIDYMNKHKWLDSVITTPMDLPKNELLSLVIVGLILEIEELPSTENITLDDILRACGKYYGP